MRVCITDALDELQPDERITDATDNMADALRTRISDALKDLQRDVGITDSVGGAG